MSDEARSVGEELSTLSTPPTVGTTVETDDTTRIQNLDPRRAREGILGGSGGEEGKPGAGPVDAVWAKALDRRAACERGVCAYVNPDGRRNDALGARGCDGYAASRGTDADGRPLVRWGLCPRHRAWWKAERIRVAAAKRGTS